MTVEFGIVEYSMISLAGALCIGAQISMVENISLHYDAYFLPYAHAHVCNDVTYDTQMHNSD